MQRLLSKLLLVEGIAAVAAFSLTCILMLADVFAREFLAHSITGALKLAVFSAIVAAILGLTIAVGNNAHFRVGFADNILPFAWVGRVGDLISALLFLGLCWYSIEFVSESKQFNEKAEVIYIPLWPIQAIFIYGFGSAALRHLVFAMQPELKPSSANQG